MTFPKVVVDGTEYQIVVCPDFGLHESHQWNWYAKYPEAGEKWLYCPGVSAETTPHIGRSWSDGRHLEDACPCPQEPCGLVDRMKVVAECDQHPPQAAQTMRQRHEAKDCPGFRPDGRFNPNKEK